MLFKLVSRTLVALATGLLLTHVALADEAQIRKNIAERFPDWPKIDELTKTPLAGIYELRMGSQIFYVDETGNYIIEGSLIDTKTRSSLTEARINKLTAVDFNQLALKDAMVWKNGTGARKIAVFADPNCGYCKRFEADLQKVKDVTVYTFLIPVLGGDSPQKSEAIWCAKEPAKAWLTWMLDGKMPPRNMGPACKTPIDRNMEFARKYRINGTPAIFFADGTRIPGAITAERIEQLLVAASTAKPASSTSSTTN
jgi:thiol:disulfide interchange protein DsbC